MTYASNDATSTDDECDMYITLVRRCNCLRPGTTSTGNDININQLHFV